MSPPISDALRSYSAAGTLVKGVPSSQLYRALSKHMFDGHISLFVGVLPARFFSVKCQSNILKFTRAPNERRGGKANTLINSFPSAVALFARIFVSSSRHVNVFIINYFISDWLSLTIIVHGVRTGSENGRLRPEPASADSIFRSSGCRADYQL